MATNFILFDGKSRDNLLPLTYTRPVADIRVGILTIREKWEKYLNEELTFLTSSYLAKKFPPRVESNNILINGSVLPVPDLLGKITSLKVNQALVHHDEIIAVRLDQKSVSGFNHANTGGYELLPYKEGEILQIQHLWDIFKDNGREIENDFQLLTKGRKSAPLGNTVQVIGDHYFVEDGFQGAYFTLNANTGPVYLGKNSEIMEGSVVRGPFVLGEHSVLKIGAKIYGPTTIGPYCKVGGEVNNSVFMGYANKAHDGFLGNAVIGEWCNIGADSNNSNLKNNYDEVRLWNYPTERFEKTGLQFCGLVMGDHSKCGINTMFNTGTVVGVSANIFGAGFPRNFIPSFAWGGAHGFTVYNFKKACEVAAKVFERRELEFDDEEQSILQHIFDETTKYRKF